MKIRSVLKNSSFWLLLILALGVLLRLYRLDGLPAAMWGDVIEGYKFTQGVMNGNFYWSYEFGGDGPLFSYLVAFLGFFLGLSFYTLKLSSAVAGILLIPAVYLFSKELFDEQTALFTAFLVSIAKWPLIFSRMAKPHIMVPLFTATVFYFLVKYKNKDEKKYLVVTGTLMGLGMYTQAGFWGVPAAVFVVYISLRRFKDLHYLILPFLLLTIPFVYDFLIVKDIFNGGSFFGEKLGLQITLFEKLIIYTENFVKNILMFHFKGGHVFRNNPPGSPQMDVVSGALFLLGVFFLIKNRKKYISILLLLAFVIIQIPAILDVANPDSVPNAGRSIGLIPVVFAVAGYGLSRIYKQLRARFAVLSHTVLLVVILVLLFLNFKQVFIDYPRGLPDMNVAFGKLIAKEIDGLEKDTEVYISGCCWGEWGQPEPNSIRFNLNKQREIKFFEADNNTESFNCAAMDTYEEDLYFVIDPDDNQTVEDIRECFPGAVYKDIVAGDHVVARTILVY